MVLYVCFNDTRFLFESKARRVARPEKAPPGLLAERRVVDKASIKYRLATRELRVLQPSCS
jgi:hypothetical protein